MKIFAILCLIGCWTLKQFVFKKSSCRWRIFKIYNYAKNAKNATANSLLLKENFCE